MPGIVIENKGKKYIVREEGCEGIWEVCEDFLDAVDYISWILNERDVGQRIVKIDVRNGKVIREGDSFLQANSDIG
ncbi:MAG: hypothetical protein DRP74_00435 [Candidatus Omnitrophota bacterium]|nr:MAG: hypothetical protein DRP74_00435 [Candidatus Omnitrophota bacterium]